MGCVYLVSKMCYDQLINMYASEGDMLSIIVFYRVL